MFNFSCFKKPKEDAKITAFPKTFPEIHNKIVRFESVVPVDRYSSAFSKPVLVSLGPTKTYNYGFVINIEYLLEVSCLTAPRNALAVSYAVDGFVVGKSCHDFFPKDRDMPKDSFFRYQMLSERLQATYYYEDGIRYLAGVCFYDRSKESFAVTSEAFKHALAIKEQYPPRFRVMKNERGDAMYCIKEDLKTGTDELEECREDGKVYEEERKEEPEPATTEDSLLHEVHALTVSIESPREDVRIYLGEEGVEYSHEESIAFIRGFISFYWMNLKDVIIPKNAIAVGFAVDPFRYLSRNPSATYRKLSENCYAQYVDHKGAECLSEIVYCLNSTQPPDSWLDADYLVMEAAIRESAQTPITNHWNPSACDYLRSYKRYCKTAGKEVSVHCSKGKKPVHQTFNYSTLEWKNEECEECEEDVKTYKFEGETSEFQNSRSLSGASSNPGTPLVKDEVDVTTVKELG